ncbi:inositol polyphosphate-4-phosphatase type I A isoform X4 [Halyomorpha halys]|uniref:inositol polyphosphate-4-phosphatase type I A isoform X4 n=1 Tax=Halyomorpha halys TaxID=286706 RepID=UPI0006D4D497|nr:type I inositol 3,4-bisphosphate 4-phosphatase isoform X4 [Halyomorpha halys]
MRFNKQELLTLATQPSQEFDKEGILYLRERQDGFFRRTERRDSKRGKKSKSIRELSCYSGTSKVSLERWCRLRGNLLFYFKSRDQWSEPIGVIILEQCTIKLDPPTQEGPYGFTLVYDGGFDQHLAANSETERDSWLDTIQLVSYNKMRAKMQELQERLETKRGHDPDLDVHMWRLRRGNTIDPSELPVCEISLACDNLLCDGNGRPPNPGLAVHVFIPSAALWLKYANTEIIQRSSNPSFLSTISFRSSDGLNGETKIKFTAFDVRETVSQTATPIGSACVTLSSLQETDRLRIPLKGNNNTTVGFLSIHVWSLEREDSNASTESTPLRTVSHHDSLVYCHRRSQSLPPRLGCKLKLPRQGAFKHIFGNTTVQTYRFHSGLGGDISVHEVMAESMLCFQLPQQLLGLWINEEKELLQEVSGMGELVEPWHSLQVELLDRHLHLLHLYSQAKENLQAHKGSFFKPSSRKFDRSLEFAPVNLHLQRMWVQNDTLKKCGFYDIITVGAFTAHSHKSKNGGLIKLLQQVKESPIKNKSENVVIDKISMAHDAIQAIKQLRREVVDGMKSLMKLAKEKKTAGMLPICDDMVAKTRTLLTLWDPGLVEEALKFVEEHKVSRTEGTPSPFKRITQQLRFTGSPDSPSQEAFLTFPDDTSTPIDENYNLEQSIKKSEEHSQENGEVEEKKKDPGLWLDTHAMCSSPSANYYRPTEEPEPWDLTQLNIEASVMCLVSKVKFLCGRCSSPAVRLRNTQKSFGRSQSFRSELCSPQVPVSENSEQVQKEQNDNSPLKTNGEVTDVPPKPPPRNKFTEGLELANMSDWSRELRPSMKKLRQAMDGLLKTARLTHSVFRLQEDKRSAQRSCNVRYRRHVCFSHALTSLVTGLMARLWCQKADTMFLHVLTTVGPLAYFEGLLSYYGDEIDMWGDMAVAIEDLKTVTFTLVHSSPNSNRGGSYSPRVVGPRCSLQVQIPAPDSVLSLLPLSAGTSFHVTPVFFNVGINEEATLAENLGTAKPQERSNADNFLLLNDYFHRFRKIGIPSVCTTVRGISDDKPQEGLKAQEGSARGRHHSLNDLIGQLKYEISSSKSKNVNILQLAGHICRRMKGLRFTSCKSAKDRTGMSVTLEQVNILSMEYDLAEHEYQKALDCMRSEGTRRENTYKNTGLRKYAFNSLQILTLPKMYRPPAGTFGSAQT